MTFSVSTLCLASGAPLLLRIDSHLLRGLGAALFTVGFVMAATPAFADENILAVDNGEVRCRASKADLTRISLKDDRFVSVSRVQTGVEGQDFSIVHEPTRGDIYISVPEAYSKPNISFFGTTQKGLVYKFDCQIGGDSAVQVFVGNADIENPSAKPEVLT
ncbi:MAG: conjugal transfer protein TraK, partial [Sphingomonas sp. 28-62-20]|uniref:TraK domain-containing protein n=1 Tax=Sphingomonas sp. 28-62-20 TaxID=1970433 RepID=UPI000BC889FE